MPIFLVDMSLSSPGHDYAPLWRAMNDAHAQRLMDTTWVVDVKQSVDDVTRALLSHLPKGDRLFVMEFRADTPWTATGMDEDTKAWLRQRLPGVKGVSPAPKDELN